MGLFGSAGGKGIIRRVRLLDVQVTGGGNVGALTGSNSGIISASHATDEIAGNTASGGLVGFNNGSITNSSASCDVTGGSVGGGLVGEQHGLLIASYATGDVSGIDLIGGLTGRNGGKITAAYATGGATASGAFAGGLVAINQGAEGIIGTVVASYSTGPVAGASDVGGLIGYEDGSTTDGYWNIQTSGQSSSSAGAGRTTDQLRSPTGYQGIYRRWNVDVDNADGDHDPSTGRDDPWYFGTADEYPELRQGDYDADDDRMIEIGSLVRLNAIRWDLDGNGAYEDAAYLAAFPDAVANMGCASSRCRGYELSDDLDFDTDGDGSVDSDDEFWNEGMGWEPMGVSWLSFDTRLMGNGHVISNLFVRRQEQWDVGLFGVIGSTGHVRGVGLASVDVEGDNGVGGPVGVNVGKVSACYVSGSMVGKGNRVGGLVGTGGGGIITSSYSAADVTGAEGVGGLIGYDNLGTVFASYAVGNVHAENHAGGLIGFTIEGKVEASYSTGSVIGSGDYIGGVICKRNSKVRFTYWDVEGSGNSASDGGDGKTIEELQNPTGYEGIYAGWNLDLDDDGSADVPWNFGTDLQYPVLKVDFNGDGEATWQEFGYQRGLSATAADYNPVVGRRQEIRTVLRAGVPRQGATFQWQRASSAGWRDVGPASPTKSVEFDTSGTRTYRAVVTLDSGVVLASDPVSLTWRLPDVSVTPSDPTPVIGQAIMATAGVESGSVKVSSYQWRRRFGEQWREVGPAARTKRLIFHFAETATYRAVVTLATGEVAYSEPVTLSWTPGVYITSSEYSPRASQLITLTPHLGGIGGEVSSYRWQYQAAGISWVNIGKERDLVITHGGGGIREYRVQVTMSTGEEVTADPLVINWRDR